MDKNSFAGQALRRAVSILSLRPNLAQKTALGEAVVRDGLACNYLEGETQIPVDMPLELGGGDEAASPGVFGRAAICSCIAIGIKMTATREFIPLEAVRVRIEQSWDGRGLLGFEGVPAAALDTRIAIELTSALDAEALDQLVTCALSIDPWYLMLTQAQKVSTHVTVTREAA